MVIGASAACQLRMQARIPLRHAWHLIKNVRRITYCTVGTHICVYLALDCRRSWALCRLPSRVRRFHLLFLGRSGLARGGGAIIMSKKYDYFYSSVLSKPLRVFLGGGYHPRTVECPIVNNHAGHAVCPPSNWCTSSSCGVAWSDGRRRRVVCE